MYNFKCMKKLKGTQLKCKHIKELWKKAMCGEPFTIESNTENLKIVIQRE